jgi:hypothetical protein
MSPRSFMRRKIASTAARWRGCVVRTKSSFVISNLG